MGIAYFLAKDKSILDTLIVIISLTSLSLNNFKEKYPYIEKLLDKFTNASFKMLKYTFIIIGVLSLICIIVIFSLIYIEYIVDYNMYFCIAVLAYSIILIGLGCWIPKLDENSQNSPSEIRVQYGIFWLFLLCTYLVSIFIYYYKPIIL